MRKSWEIAGIMRSKSWVIHVKSCIPRVSRAVLLITCITHATGYYESVIPCQSVPDTSILPAYSATICAVIIGPRVELVEGQVNLVKSCRILQIQEAWCALIAPRILTMFIGSQTLLLASLGTCLCLVNRDNLYIFVKSCRVKDSVTALLCI